ncbi:MAG: sensor histidine kinase, partial [Ktedonobacterales bacterium]
HRALLKLVIDQLPSGVYLVRGPDARLVLANRAAMAVWGANWPTDQPMMDFLAASGTKIQATDGRPLEAGQLATLRAVRSGEAIRHHEEVIRRPDGTTLPILLNAVTLDPALLQTLPASDGAETPARSADAHVALIVLQDVTALKETEHLKDEFIAIAAHELKTPMAAVKGYAEMLRKRTTPGDSALADWQFEALETIDQATTRLVELTDDLLDVARIQAGRIELRIEPHDVVALCRRVAHRLAITSEQHTVTVSTPNDYVVACLDVRRIEQVVSNLLNNAIKYSPNGGPVSIVVREDGAAGRAVITVKDSGIGIPESEQGRLFGRFARADNAREQGIKGTGLGLYLCRELVELHGGRIWFESQLGAGSTFSFTLPLAAE